MIWLETSWKNKNLLNVGQVTKEAQRFSNVRKGEDLPQTISQLGRFTNYSSLFPLFFREFLSR
jgi:hypothetical protein